MNVFEAVKEAVTAREAAESYGIVVRRNGMACCPFHNDHDPSMKLDRRFHCFGCQADGDVIDFTARLFGLNPREAAEKLAADFGIQYDRRFARGTRPDKGCALNADPSRPSVIARLEAAREYQKAENRCFRVLRDYSLLLRDWKERYAPKPTDEDWHPLFCEALQRLDYIEYLLDTLLSGDIEERADIVKDFGKEVTRLEQRISELAPGGTGSRTPGGERGEQSRRGHTPPAHAVHDRAV